ncbi:hypothetical protein ANO11243_002680 [Dothideomycetidae sp. 11243]|nr:hypothetical protein ANO11243_002680 [fungal sp. No.11243]
MKLVLSTIGIVAIASAVPLPTTNTRADAIPVTANELNGPCRPVTLIFARGSTERGNIGKDVGGPLSVALKARYGDTGVATQGVQYQADLPGNLLPAGCYDQGIEDMAADIKRAASKCPKTKIVIGGYSQGAACTHAAVAKLKPSTIVRIAAAVTFGDTRNKQSGGHLSPIPASRTKIFCAKGDPVCKGKVAVEPAHFSYTQDVPYAADFIEDHMEKSLH